MKKISPFSILLILSMLLLSSCFELAEEYKLTANGSGTYGLTLNASQSKRQLERFFAQDSIGRTAIPSKAEIDHLIHENAYAFDSCNGISLSNYSCDLNNYIVKLAFDFTSIEALNDAFFSVYGNRNIQFKNTTNEMSRLITEKQIIQFKKSIVPFRYTDLGTGRIKSVTRSAHPLPDCSCPITKVSKESISSFTDLSLKEFLVASQCHNLKLSK